MYRFNNQMEWKYINNIVIHFTVALLMSLQIFIANDLISFSWFSQSCNYFSGVAEINMFLFIPHTTPVFN